MVHTLRVAAVLGLTLGGCSTGRQTVFLAPSNETIEAGSEMSYGGDGYNVYITNGSSVPIMVTGLRLYECENIKTLCDVAIEIKVPIEPGRRNNVYVVRTDNMTRASHFRFHFTWEQKPTPR